MANVPRRALLQTIPLAGSLFAARRLNLVFIIADQHSGMALGCTGHPIVRTPHLDSLAKQGAVFTHAYTAGMVCAPSRASLDTGLHVQTHGVRNNGVRLPDITSIFGLLNGAGYVAPKAHPSGLTDEYLTWASGLGYKDITNPIIGDKTKAGIIPMPYRFEVGRAGLSPEHSLDAFAIEQAIRQIREQEQQPFGMWVRLHGSHDPYVVPAPWNTLYRASDLPMPPHRDGEYDRKPPRAKRAWQAQGADKLNHDQIRTILAHYYGMVTYTDHLVGNFLDALHGAGLDDNTVVIYTADHGDTMGHHRMFTKGFAFNEPAMRIPMIIRAPGKFRRGVKVDSLISGVDVLPTLLELLDLPIPRGLHGSSMVPLWREGKRPQPERVFSGQGYEGLDRAVMIRTRQWKYARYDDGGRELYDLEKDPHELDNRIDDSTYADTARKLARDLQEWDGVTAHREPALPAGTDPERARRIHEAFAKWKAESLAQN